MTVRPKNNNGVDNMPTSIVPDVKAGIVTTVKDEGNEVTTNKVMEKIWKITESFIRAWFCVSVLQGQHIVDYFNLISAGKNKKNNPEREKYLASIKYMFPAIVTDVFTEQNLLDQVKLELLSKVHSPVIDALQKKGLGLGAAIKIYSCFGDKSLRKIMDSPLEALLEVGYDREMGNFLCKRMKIDIPLHTKQLDGLKKTLSRLCKNGSTAVELPRAIYLANKYELKKTELIEEDTAEYKKFLEALEKDSSIFYKVFPSNANFLPNKKTPEELLYTNKARNEEELFENSNKNVQNNSLKGNGFNTSNSNDLNGKDFDNVKNFNNVDGKGSDTIESFNTETEESFNTETKESFNSDTKESFNSDTKKYKHIVALKDWAIKEQKEIILLKKFLERPCPPLQFKLEQGSLTADQYEVAQNLLSVSFGIVHGHPGSGKTTLLSYIGTELTKHNMIVIYAALTGKAASKIQEFTQTNSYTLHRLLGIKKDPQEEICSGKGLPFYKEAKPIKIFKNAQALIIDEATMIDDGIWHVLLEKLHQYPSIDRLYLFGDEKQLPPIDPGFPFGTLLATDKIHKFFLSTNLRTASDTKLAKIVDNLCVGLDNSYNKKTAENIVTEIKNCSVDYKKLLNPNINTECFLKNALEYIKNNNGMKNCKNEENLSDENLLDENLSDENLFIEQTEVDSDTGEQVDSDTGEQTKADTRKQIIIKKHTIEKDITKNVIKKEIIESKLEKDFTELKLAEVEQTKFRSSNNKGEESELIIPKKRILLKNRNNHLGNVSGYCSNNSLSDSSLAKYLDGDGSFDNSFEFIDMSRVAPFDNTLEKIAFAVKEDLYTEMLANKAKNGVDNTIVEEDCEFGKYSVYVSPEITTVLTRIIGDVCIEKNILPNEIFQKMQILTFSRVATSTLNNHIRNIIFQDKKKYHQGEKLICKKNDPKTGIYNGEVAYIQQVPDDNYCENSDLTIKNNYKLYFPDRKTCGFFSRETIDQNYQYAYALTVHKAQGSEWAATIVIFFPEDKNNLTINLLFTALTRAKNKTILFCPENILIHILNRKSPKRTGLTQFL